MSTTVLGLRRERRRAVVLERHGSLPVDDVRSILARHGIELLVPAGQQRLRQRVY